MQLWRDREREEFMPLTISLRPFSLWVARPCAILQIHPYLCVSSIHANFSLLCALYFYASILFVCYFCSCVFFCFCGGS